MSKNIFSKQAVKDFVQQKIKLSNNVSKIKEELTKELMTELIKQYFLENYSEQEVDDALSEYVISVVRKTAVQIPTVLTPFVKPFVKTLTPSSGEKVGEIVQNKLAPLLQSGKVSKEVIGYLCNLDYSKQFFGVSSYAVLKKTSREEINNDRMYAGHSRYYKQYLIIFGEYYLLTSQWLDKSKDKVVEFIRKYNQ